MRTQFLTGALVVICSLGLVACSDDDDTNPVCGDDIATGTETCDGPDLLNNDCTTVGMGYTGGTLACNTYCDGWDVTGCTGGTTCGDDTAAGTETCDGPDLRGNDCTSIGQGFTGGTLACNANCEGWDVAGCTGGDTCGDDNIDGMELCDGLDLDGNDCASIGMGYVDGTLACNGTCDGWDTTGCNMPVCGDNTAEGTEVCDGADLLMNDCTTVPGTYTGGTLACNGNCDGWDLTGCTGGGPACGDGNVDTGEDCDLTNLDGESCTTIPGGYTGGTLACTGTCTFDVSGCTGGSPCTEYVTDGSFEAGTPSTAWTEASTAFGSPLCDVGNCGVGAGTGPFDGNIWAWFGGVAAEEDAQLTQTVTIPTGATNLGFFLEMPVCDGATDYFEVLVDGNQEYVVYGDDAMCNTVGYTQILVDITAYADGASHTIEFHGHTYSVNGGVTNFFVDMAQGCPTALSCGDGIVVSPEECDGTNLAGADCTTVPGGFGGGTLTCGASCTFDTTGCTMPVCGDNVADPGEHCDGTDMGGYTGTTCTDYGYTGGSITCTAGCLADMSACTGGPVAGWTCNATFYNAADGCDCGCGVMDPDCADATAGSCDYCGLAGSCSTPGAGCPGTIDPANNAQCI